jgi:hypothetical protein
MNYTNTYIIESENIQPMIQQVKNLDDAFKEGCFRCRFDGCDKKYVHHSIRVK